MEDYGYKVNLLGKASTSMSESQRQHTCYIYKRNDDDKSCNAGVPKCNKFFSKGLDICKEEGALQKHVDETINRYYEEAASKKRKRSEVDYKEQRRGLICIDWM